MSDWRHDVLLVFSCFFMWLLFNWTATKVEYITQIRIYKTYFWFLTRQGATPHFSPALQWYDTVGWVMWPVKPSPKWPIMCRVGRKTLLYHTAAVSETMQERWRSFWAHLVMFILVLRGSCQLSSELRAFYIVSWSYCACAWRLRTTSSVLQCIMNRTLAADAQHTASCAVERDDRNNKVIADCYSPDYILQVRRPV